MLHKAGQEIPELAVNLHMRWSNVFKLRRDEAKVRNLSTLLLEQAEISAGAQLPDPSAFVQRMNPVLLG